MLLITLILTIFNHIVLLNIAKQLDYIKKMTDKSNGNLDYLMSIKKNNNCTLKNDGACRC